VPLPEDDLVAAEPADCAICGQTYDCPTAATSVACCPDCLESIERSHGWRGPPPEAPIGLRAITPAAARASGLEQATFAFLFSEDVGSQWGWINRYTWCLLEAARIGRGARAVHDKTSGLISVWTRGGHEDLAHQIAQAESRC